MGRENNDGTIGWTKAERAVFRRLKSPAAIQKYLDTMTYKVGNTYSCPRETMREKTADCFDGALFGAAALRQINYPPFIMDLRSGLGDDDHVLAVFRERGCFGALGSSNYVCLAWREPIYRTLRELAMSYFELYFNLRGKKTLREYSRLMNLARYDRENWMFENRILKTIASDLDDMPHYHLLTPAQIQSLSRTDKRTFKACTTGMKKDGSFEKKSSAAYFSRK